MVKTLQKKISERIDRTKEFDEEELKALIDREISGDEESRYLSLEVKKILRKEIFYEIRQLGILQELLADEETTEIMVNGTSQIFVEKSGKIEQLPIRFEEREKLLQVIQQIVSSCNRVVNEAVPIVDARLSDGSRVNVVLPPVALNGPILTIRRFPEKKVTMEDLIAWNALSREVSIFLEKLVVSGYNILVSGGTGCGKTTFLNALSDFIPKEQRVISIEDSAELKLDGLPNLVRLETRSAGISGGYEITLRDLIKASLRMRPDRLIIGEVRGKETVDMLQSMNVGHNAMSTVHANGVRDVVSRLETMVLMGMELPIPAIRRQIVSGFDLLIHLGRTRDGKRKVLEIAEPVGIENSEVKLHSLYRFEEEPERKIKERKTDRENTAVVGRLIKKGELQNVEKLKAAGFVV